MMVVTSSLCLDENERTHGFKCLKVKTFIIITLLEEGKKCFFLLLCFITCVSCCLFCFSVKECHINQLVHFPLSNKLRLIF